MQFADFNVLQGDLVGPDNGFQRLKKRSLRPSHWTCTLSFNDCWLILIGIANGWDLSSPPRNHSIPLKFNN